MAQAHTCERGCSGRFGHSVWLSVCTGYLYIFPNNNPKTIGAKVTKFHENDRLQLQAACVAKTFWSRRAIKGELTTLSIPLWGNYFSVLHHSSRFRRLWSHACQPGNEQYYWETHCCKVTDGSQQLGALLMVPLPCPWCCNDSTSVRNKYLIYNNGTPILSRDTIHPGANPPTRNRADN